MYYFLIIINDEENSNLAMCFINLQNLPKQLVLTLSFLALSWPLLGQAHLLDYAVVKTNMEVRKNTIVISVKIPIALNVEATTPEDKRALLTSYFNEQLKILNLDKPCVGSITSFNVKEDPEKPNSTFAGAFTCAAEIRSLADISIHSTLFGDFFKTFDHFITITLGTNSKDIILNHELADFSAKTAAEVPVSPSSLSPTAPPLPASSSPTPKIKKIPDLPKKESTSLPREAVNVEQKQEGREDNLAIVTRRFISLGIEHILFGYDHILFLIVAVIIITNFKNALILITSFTLAHSTTLILASLNLINITSRIVEPLIALSISLVAFRNIYIMRKGSALVKLKERWLATFGFGLIHGLGFAGALTEIGIPRTYFFPALITFNIGIEIGQLLIFAALFVILRFIRRWPKILERTTLITSWVVGLTAVFWFFQRILK